VYKRQLDKPYISEFLLKTLEINRIPVIHNLVAEEYRKGRNFNLISENEAVAKFTNDPDCLLYTNSENSISWIEEKLQHTRLPEQIRLFKNKLVFRDLLKDIYPDYFYARVSLDSIDSLDVKKFSFPFIIKPAVGFFSLGVYLVENPDVWKGIVLTIKNEVELIKNLYPPEVLHTGEFIIEECINGDEFAVDCYFDNSGKPVVLNIMKHIFSSGKDVNDRVYITSKEIIEEFKGIITAFLSRIGDITGIRNFPAHIEVRIDSKGAIMPIEVNPLRFGGWCSTPDLAWHAFGINLYEYLFQQKQPDWSKLLEGKDGMVYSNIVLNNSTGVEGKFVNSFDYEKLLSTFEKPLELRKTDFTKFPLFGFLFCETRNQNMHELENILFSDLKEYIV
jgi:hypothetical protein